MAILHKDEAPITQTKGAGRSSPGLAFSRHLVGLVQASLEDDKAIDIVVIDLTGKSSIADFMMIASGTSQRHVGAISEHLREKLKAATTSNVSVEGANRCDWVLIDSGDVIVHIFRPEVRSFYNLEKMWGADFQDSQSPDASSDASRPDASSDAPRPDASSDAPRPNANDDAPAAKH